MAQARAPGGYGLIGEGGKCGRMLRAHRLAWVIEYGSIPDGLSILHHCDNPPCVNVLHLFLGTQATNQADMASKGRGRGRIGLGEENGRARVTRVQAIEIIQRVQAGEIRAALAREYQIAPQTVSAIVTGQNWPELAEWRRRQG